MQFQVRAELGYTVGAPASFLFNVAAAQNRFQRVIDEHLEIEGGSPPQEHLWNGGKFHRTTSHGPTLRLRYEALVDVQPELSKTRELPVRTLAELPPEVLTYLSPSRYCQSDSLFRFAQSDLFSPGLSGFGLVTHICNWIREKVAYQRGTTTAVTSAFDTVTERQGVCRDYAHLGIALTRALGIPARFVSAYAYGLQPPDFHAVFEAYLGDRWYLFDATRLAPQTSFVRIGIGRDAADTSFATIFGPVMPQSMQLMAEPERGVVPEYVLDPISSAE